MKIQTQRKHDNVKTQWHELKRKHQWYNISEREHNWNTTHDTQVTLKVRRGECRLEDYMLPPRNVKEETPEQSGKSVSKQNTVFTGREECKTTDQNI